MDGRDEGSEGAGLACAGACVGYGYEACESWGERSEDYEETDGIFEGFGE